MDAGAFMGVGSFWFKITISFAITQVFTTWYGSSSKALPFFQAIFLLIE